MQCKSRGAKEYRDAQHYKINYSILIVSWDVALNRATRPS